MAVVTIASSRFGEVQVEQEQVLQFPEGILGFPGIHEYVLVDNPGGGPFLWLHAVGSAHLAFVVMDPLLFKPDYEVRVRPEDLESIQIDNIASAKVLVILVIPSDPRKMTANLQGPIIINTGNGKGKQLVLTGSNEYTTKYPVFKDEPQVAPASDGVPPSPSRRD